MTSRREVLLWGAKTGGLLVASTSAGSDAMETPPIAQGSAHSLPDPGYFGSEGQRLPHRPDGEFINPVLAGDRPDPSVLKDGENYYAVFSSFHYYPGLLIWRSTDLISWTPMTCALKKRVGSVYALDLVKYAGRYFIYIPAVLEPGDPSPDVGGDQPTPRAKVFVIHADSIEGPWSDPIDLGIEGLYDPAHVVGEDDKRYLFLAFGFRVRLADDGLRTLGKPERVYAGWKIPDDWEIEAFGLEGPKLIRRNGWFYMFSAQGGTAGPPTSHMVIVARSRSIHGPWENCTQNPIVRTSSSREPWWSRGHAMPVEGPLGDWWLVYHGYESGYRSLGRQMLLDRFEWTADEWPRALGGDLSRTSKRPQPTIDNRTDVTLSGGFEPSDLGRKWSFYKPQASYLQRASFSNHALTLVSQGNSPGDSSPLALITGDIDYQIDVDMELRGGSEAGLLLFYNEHLFTGIGLSASARRQYVLGKTSVWDQPEKVQTSRVKLRVRNRDQVATFFEFREGSWRKIFSVEVSGYNHNMGQGFVSLRPALFACGNGHAIFRDLKYRANVAVENHPKLTHFGV